MLVFLAALSRLFKPSVGFPLPALCCVSPLRSIDWGDELASRGLWCHSSPEASHKDCGPVCADASGSHFALECPNGLSRDCKRGCASVGMNGIAAAPPEDGKQACEYNGPEELFAWARSQNAFVDVRIELRRSPNSTTIQGVYANAAVAKGEVLASIPQSLIISGNASEDARVGSWCSLVPVLRAELQLQKCSRFWPYLKILSDARIDLPNAWALDELEMLGDQPAVNWVRHSESFAHICGGNLTDPLTARALQLVATRAGPAYTGMVPVHDMFNHRGGRWQNTLVEAENGRVDVIASKNIANGSQIYNFYKPGAPWVFRDYGFIEQPPAVWWFDVPQWHFEWTVLEGGGVHWHTWFDTTPSTAFLRQFVRDATSFLADLKQQQSMRARVNGSRNYELAIAYQNALSESVNLGLLDAKRLLLRDEADSEL